MTTDDTAEELDFEWPGEEFKALAAKVRKSQAWADALPDAWAAARLGNWSKLRTANATCAVIFGKPGDHPRDIQTAARRPLDAVVLTEDERERAREAAAEALAIARQGQVRNRERLAAEKAAAKAAEQPPQAGAA